MTLKLTPAILKQAYDLLSVTPPFSSWNLPDSDDVVFRVLKTKTMHAQITTQRGHKPVIEVSAGKNGHTNTLLSTMAHEMIHLHEETYKIRWRGANHHGTAFRKWAAQVCKVHGFDPQLFY